MQTKIQKKKKGRGKEGKKKEGREKEAIKVYYLRML